MGEEEKEGKREKGRGKETEHAVNSEMWLPNLGLG